MRKLIIGIIIGSLLTTTYVYALRIDSAPNFTDLTDISQMVRLNNYLQNLANIVNGRYALNIKTSVPTIAGDEGDIVAYQDGSNYRIYIYLNSAWRQWNSD